MQAQRMSAWHDRLPIEKQAEARPTGRFLITRSWAVHGSCAGPTVLPACATHANSLHCGRHVHINGCAVQEQAAPLVGIPQHSLRIFCKSAGGA